jgi:hypothetical protein
MSTLESGLWNKYKFRSAHYQQQLPLNMACYFPFNKYQYLVNYPIDVSFRKPYQLLTCKLYLNSPLRRAICFEGAD